MATDIESFREIWAADFEFNSTPGDPPSPICLVATELRSGRCVRVWRDDLLRMPQPPYPIDESVLFVAYYASAEIGCHHSLGWSTPANVIDLYAEFRSRTNGLDHPGGAGLLAACAAYGVSTISAETKEAMRAHVLTGAQDTAESRRQTLDYCESDVAALGALAAKMLPGVHVDQALLRGRYAAAVGSIEHNGVPIDRPAYDLLIDTWDALSTELVSSVGSRFDAYKDGVFSEKRFGAWLLARGIPWPKTPQGRPSLADETFDTMSQAYPELEPLRDVRRFRSKLRKVNLQIGADSRSRTLLSMFRSRTGRNQPSTASFLFNLPKWLHGLLRPPEGNGVAILDYDQQEFAIAAALSRDDAMIRAYRSGDPYLASAILVGAAPPGATEETHGEVREVFKRVELALQYGMGAESLARLIRSSVDEARELLEKRRRAYSTMETWSNAVVNHASLHGELHTINGWNLHVRPPLNDRSLRNFPMQAHGAEIMRIACILTTEAGIRVCAPVHDALVVEAPLAELADVVEATRSAMVEAGRAVLDGFELRVGEKIATHHERYLPKKGRAMWELVRDTVGRLRGPAAAELLS